MSHPALFASAEERREAMERPALIARRGPALSAIQALRSARLASAWVVGIGSETFQAPIAVAIMHRLAIVAALFTLSACHPFLPSRSRSKPIPNRAIIAAALYAAIALIMSARSTTCDVASACQTQTTLATVTSSVEKAKFLVTTITTSDVAEGALSLPRDTIAIYTAAHIT